MDRLEAVGRRVLRLDAHIVFVITGSGATLLSGELSTVVTGRHLGVSVVAEAEASSE